MSIKKEETETLQIEAGENGHNGVKLEVDEESFKSEDSYSPEDYEDKKKVKSESLYQPQLYVEYESKTEEAASKFVVLDESTYANKQLGLSGQEENMTCDCREETSKKGDRKNLACGEDSDCINRITSVECVNEFCTCGGDCRNQRFQRREYAPVTVIQTEKKGYGLRCDADINPGSFVYEYIGEVIDESNFRKRMVNYDQKKFKHFYFMMLQKNEFIDATMKGCLARFCNHSCNPNAYVDKWVVGKKLRMGIFSKRKIFKGEEITFDYNVDRYGAEAQPCYCGEPNCIGFLGGKTQTDSALILPDGISEALGVTHEQEKMWLKEHKKSTKGTKKTDDSNVNDEFINSLAVSALEADDVSKVMSSLMKSQELSVIKKLTERIYLTEDDAINLRVLRIHGYQTLSVVIKDYVDNPDLIKMILEILLKWPKMTRNKISSSKIEEVVKDLNATSQDDEVVELTTDLLKQWGELEMAYRIPKKSSTSDSKSPPSLLFGRGRESSNEPGRVYEGELLPDGWEWAKDPTSSEPYFFHRVRDVTQWEKPDKEEKEPYRPTGPKGSKAPDGPRRKNNYEDERVKQAEEEFKKRKEQEAKKAQKKSQSVEEIIRRSHEEAEKLKKEEEERLKEEERRKKEKIALRKSKKTPVKKHREPPSLELQWNKCFAGYIPNLIKKYEKEIGHEHLKACARDIVHILSEKEMKRNKEAPPKEFSDSKTKKLKEYSRVYMDKFVIKYKEKQKKRENGSGPADGPDAKKLKVDDQQ